MEHGVGEPPKENTLKWYDLRQKPLKKEAQDPTHPLLVPILDVGIVMLVTLLIISQGNIPSLHCKELNK